MFNPGHQPDEHSPPRRSLHKGRRARLVRNRAGRTCDVYRTYEQLEGITPLQTLFLFQMDSFFPG